MTQKPVRRRRRRGTGKKYFTEVHEQAIIKYVATDDIRVRTELYNQYLGDLGWAPMFEGRKDVMRGEYSDRDISQLALAMRDAINPEEISNA